MIRRTVRTIGGLRHLWNLWVSTARREEGSATVEVAILTPLLLLLVLGSADFARIYHAQITLAGAAQAGAHYGSQSKLKSGDTDGMIDAARGDASDLATVNATARRFCECSGGGSVACTSTCSGGRAPDVFVEVTVTTTFKTALVYPGIPSNAALGQTATMRVQ